LGIDEVAVAEALASRGNGVMVNLGSTVELWPNADID